MRCITSCGVSRCRRDSDIHPLGRGKSGGVRVIYYFYDEDMPIYALLIYGKNERANLTPEQRKVVKTFATAIKALRKRK